MDVSGTRNYQNDMNNLKYTKKQIEKAKRLYKTKKYSNPQIAKMCGFESTSPIRYHCQRGKKKYYKAKSQEWRKKNPKRFREITRKAGLKYERAKRKAKKKK